MVPVKSLLCSQQPNTEPYPELIESSPHHTNFKIYINTILPFMPWCSFRFSCHNYVEATCWITTHYWILSSAKCIQCTTSHNI